MHRPWLTNRQPHRLHMLAEISIRYGPVITWSMFFKSLWPTCTISRYRSGSTLSQVRVSCLMAPSHYLDQCEGFVHVKEEYLITLQKRNHYLRCEIKETKIRYHHITRLLSAYKPVIISKYIEKCGPTCKRQMIIPRHQISQRQSVVKYGAPVEYPSRESKRGKNEFEDNIQFHIQREWRVPETSTEVRSYRAQTT